MEATARVDVKWGDHFDAQGMTGGVALVDTWDHREPRSVLYDGLVLAAVLLLLTSTPSPQVELRLLLMGYRDGWPKLEVLFINESSQPVSLVLPGDGSGHAWRTPVLEWNITPEGEDPLPPGPPGMRCGNTNSLSLADTFTLGPGRDKRVQDLWTTPPFPAPGRYRVSLTYKNVPDMKMRVTPDSPEALARLRASMPIELTSNEVVIDWAPATTTGMRPAFTLVEGEIPEPMFGRVASCFAYGVEARCTDLQKKLATKLWQKCASHSVVENVRVNDEKRIADVIAKRGLTLVKTEPYSGAVPDDKKREGSFVQIGADLVLVTDDLYPSIVVTRPDGAVQQLFFRRTRFAPIASCDATTTPSVPSPRRVSTWRVLSDKRNTVKPEILDVEPVDAVEFPRLPSE